MRVLVALGFVGLYFYVYHFMASEAVRPERRTFDEFPLQLGTWECAEAGEMEAEVEANLGVTDYLFCDWRRRKPLGLVNVYVGYHASQVREEGGGSGENSIHPPAHCLPGSGWDIVRSERVVLEAEGLPDSRAEVNRLLIAKGELRNLVYYWYQSRGRVVAEDWKKVIYVGFDRVTAGRTDGSLVRFTVPVIRGDEGRAEAMFLDLAPRVVALLPPFVPS